MQRAERESSRGEEVVTRQHPGQPAPLAPTLLVYLSINEY